MVRAHRQAWCWQDEYHGLTMEDIRQLERQTQLALQETMAQAEEEAATEDGDKAQGSPANKEPPKLLEQESKDTESVIPVNIQNAVNTAKEEAPHSAKVAAMGVSPPMHPVTNRLSMSSLGSGRRQSWGSARSRVSGTGR